MSYNAELQSLRTDCHTFGFTMFTYDLDIHPIGLNGTTGLAFFYHELNISIVVGYQAQSSMSKCPVFDLYFKIIFI